MDALKHDENIDAYPPRFFTQVNCHEPSTLDVNYMLHVIKEGSVVHKYQFNIYVNATEIANSIKNIGMYATYEVAMYCTYINAYVHIRLCHPKCLHTILY